MPKVLVVAGARRAGTASVASAIAGAVGLRVRETAAGLALMASIQKASAALARQLEDPSALAGPMSAEWLERTLPAAGAVWRLADPFPDAAALAALRGLLPQLPAVRVIGMQRDIAGFIASRRRVQPGASMLDHCLAWARSATELDAMQARHPDQVRSFSLIDLRRDPAGIAQLIADFTGMETSARDVLAKALMTDIRGRRGMLDGGVPPTLDQLALATPELLLIEQICGPIMTRRGEAVGMLRHLRRTPLPLAELLKLRPAVPSGLMVTAAPQSAVLKLQCDAGAATPGAAVMDFPAISLAGRSTITGHAVLASGAHTATQLQITLTESLSRKPVLAGIWNIKPGEQVILSERFGATHELLDVSLGLVSTPGASGGLISVDLDALFSLKA